jgi:hypothetical protein
MPAGWRDIHRIELAIAANVAHRRQALLIGAEPAIGRAAKATAVKSAPWTILRLSRRDDRSGDAQDAKEGKCGFHDHSFRITLSRATSNRQLSSSSAGCKVFTRQFYLAARFESVGLQQAASETAAA